MGFCLGILFVLRYLYVAELTNNYTHPQTDFKMDIMMYGLDPRAAEMFFNPDGTNTAEKARLGQRPTPC